MNLLNYGTTLGPGEYKIRSKFDDIAETSSKRNTRLQLLKLKETYSRRIKVSRNQHSVIL